jgi:hypothetical protein
VIGHVTDETFLTGVILNDFRREEPVLSEVEGISREAPLVRQRAYPLRATSFASSG